MNKNKVRNTELKTGGCWYRWVMHTWYHWLSNSRISLIQWEPNLSRPQPTFPCELRVHLKNSSSFSERFTGIRLIHCHGDTPPTPKSQKKPNLVRDIVLHSDAVSALTDNAFALHPLLIIHCFHNVVINKCKFENNNNNNSKY